MAVLLRCGAGMAALLLAGRVLAQPVAPPAVVPVPVPAPAPIQPGWVARGTAELQALDKVNARATVLSVKVGQSVRYGAIDITVRACFARPPDQAPDAAAFLVVSDPRPGASGFSGWMLAANPTIAILEHPIYDIRVLSCRP